MNTIGKERFLDITCNFQLTGYWVSKLMWLKKNKPELFDKIKTVLFPKDYLRFKLTGEVSVEVSDASGSFLFDVKKRSWSDEMFKLCGLPKDITPEKVHESPDVARYLLPDVAEELGLTLGIPVVGGGDQTAGGVGTVLSVRESYQLL